MLISVHLPKTAGTSFMKSLEGHFGFDLLKDNGDTPINVPVYQRNAGALKAALAVADRDFGSLRCVHGHFLPVKYLLLASKRNLTFVTWMREPVERMASHYWFWKKSYSPATALPLHKRVVEEDWSLEKFCFSEELRNLYAQFLWGFPLELFDFIGTVENFQHDHAFFAKRFLGVDLPAHKVNVGNKGDDTMYISDKGFRRAVEEHHGKDMELYGRALDMRLRILKDPASQEGA